MTKYGIFCSGFELQNQIKISVRFNILKEASIELKLIFSNSWVYLFIGLMCKTFLSPNLLILSWRELYQRRQVTLLPNVITREKNSCEQKCRDGEKRSITVWRRRVNFHTVSRTAGPVFLLSWENKTPSAAGPKAIDQARVNILCSNISVSTVVC